jgi:hypothetical protein
MHDENVAWEDTILQETWVNLERMILEAIDGWMSPDWTLALSIHFSIFLYVHDVSISAVSGSLNRRTVGIIEQFDTSTFLLSKLHYYNIFAICFGASQWRGAYYDTKLLLVLKQMSLVLPMWSRLLALSSESTRPNHIDHRDQLQSTMILLMQGWSKQKMHMGKINMSMFYNKFFYLFELIFLL